MTKCAGAPPKCYRSTPAGCVYVTTGTGFVLNFYRGGNGRISAWQFTPGTGCHPSATYTYNAGGQRVMKEDGNGKTLYHLSGGQAIAET
ncbi:MAG: hypothetical protein IID14_02170 [Candidatus Marinimicrobia bacterium]|nr:hypothetical protein [Candidatus Neomarinimicrobiota bacterium]